MQNTISTPIALSDFYAEVKLGPSQQILFQCRAELHINYCKFPVLCKLFVYAQIQPRAPA